MLLRLKGIVRPIWNEKFRATQEGSKKLYSLTENIYFISWACNEVTIFVWRYPIRQLLWPAWKVVTTCPLLMKKVMILTRLMNCFDTIWILCYFLQEYVSFTIVASYGISVNYCCCIWCCCLCWRGLWDRPAGRSGQHPSPSLQRWRPPRGGPAAPAHQPISISYVNPPTNQRKPRIFLEMVATWWSCVVWSWTNKHKPLQTVPANPRKPFFENVHHSG